MDTKKEIGRRIATARTAAGFKTVGDLAEATGGVLQRTRISNYEHGTREPDVKTFKVLAKHLKVSAAYLATLDDSLSASERDLIERFRQMSKEQQNMIISLSHTVAPTKLNEKKSA